MKPLPLPGILCIALALFSSANVLSQSPSPATASTGDTAFLAPPGDNANPPFLAVYRWGQSGLLNGLYDAYPAWLNRTVIWAEDFQPRETWDGIEGPSWQLNPWSKWVNEKPGRRWILSVVILPGDWDGKGPKQGQEAGVPVSLEEGAKGTYNEHFRKLAENLVKYNLGNTILRLGWEFNGGWYTFRALNAQKAEAYAAYWRQIVTTMRSVEGAGNLKFVWNPTQVWIPYPLEKAWPGDEYVDYVGVDVYDDSWAPDTYPLPPNASTDQVQAIREKVWDKILNDPNHGILAFKSFAERHGNKPLTFPEWGVDSRGGKSDHGGLDNPYFIEQMHNFIYDPGNNVYFHCYFDVTAGDGDHQICPDPAGKHRTKFPLSFVRFRELFSLSPGEAAH